MGMPPSPHQQQQQQHQHQQQMQLQMQMAQQAQQYMSVSAMHGGGGSGGGPQRSGAATPKSQAGSGANTPMHPMQRALSAGQQLLQGQEQPFYSQPGAPFALQALPPGIVLPESLSRGSPGPLRGLGSAPASRVQSAAQLAPHAHAGSFGGSGGGWMKPLSPPRVVLHRTGSAGSMGAASLRGSVEYGSTGGSGGSGGSAVRRTSERAGSASGGGSGFNGGGGGGFGGQPSKAPSLAGSRVGSAGRKGSSAGVATGGHAELDEYDNIKVRGKGG
jgi:hypothetical protein